MPDASIPGPSTSARVQDFQRELRAECRPGTLGIFTGYCRRLDQLLSGFFDTAAQLSKIYLSGALYDVHLTLKDIPNSTVRRYGQKIFAAQRELSADRTLGSSVDDRLPEKTARFLAENVVFAANLAVADDLYEKARGIAVESKDEDLARTLRQTIESVVATFLRDPQQHYFVAQIIENAPSLLEGLGESKSFRGVVHVALCERAHGLMPAFVKTIGEQFSPRYLRARSFEKAQIEGITRALRCDSGHGEMRVSNWILEMNGSGIVTPKVIKAVGKQLEHEAFNSPLVIPSPWLRGTFGLEKFYRRNDKYHRTAAAALHSHGTCDRNAVAVFERSLPRRNYPALWRMIENYGQQN